MESWRQQFLGLDAVPASLTLAEIEFFFAPTEQDQAFVGNRRRPLTRLGLILQIGFLRLTGRPLSAFERLPAAVLSCGGCRTILAKSAGTDWNVGVAPDRPFVADGRLRRSRDRRRREH
ncbi:DUF4158 domain-containing protein [Thalassobaculum sp. OXR-137]|uniref:DUF4158 domain-containing protein n=1 Tax=Thalassobaculum sp. OXR-137 TaxID=3100173 RepID=UPI0039FC015D